MEMWSLDELEILFLLAKERYSPRLRGGKEPTGVRNQFGECRKRNKMGTFALAATAL